VAAAAAAEEVVRWGMRACCVISKLLAAVYSVEKI
jgi:hypothetical protein